MLGPHRPNSDQKAMRKKLLAFHPLLSTDSSYCRYFSYHPELSRDELHRLTHVDYVNRLALVIEDGGELDRRRAI